MNSTIDDHVQLIMQTAAEAKVNEIVVTGGERRKMVRMASATEAEAYIKSMLAESFYCKSAVQRAWLRVVLVIVFWEAGETVPNLSGLPETELIWDAAHQAGG